MALKPELKGENVAPESSDTSTHGELNWATYSTLARAGSHSTRSARVV